MNAPSGLTIWQQIARRIRVPLGFLFAGTYFWIARPSEHSLFASLLLVLPGIALRGYASGYVKKNAELTVTGPYAFTRNPLYLGSMLIAFGFAGAARKPWLVVALAALLAMIYWPTLLGEEAYHRTRFPEFDAYANQVPRLLPRLYIREPIGAPVSRGQFSWKLYLAHREYNSLLGSILLFLALIARMGWRH